MEDGHKEEEIIETKTENTEETVKEAEPVKEETPETEEVEEIEKAIISEEKPKKTGAGSKIMAAFFFVATLGLGAFLIYHYMTFDHNPKTPEKKDEPVAQQKEEKTEKKDEDGNTITSTTVTSTVVSSDATDEAVRKVIGELFKLARIKASGRYDTIYDTSSTLIKLDEAKVLLHAEKSYGIDAFYNGSSDFTLNKEIREALIKKLEELDFVKNTDISGPHYLVGENYYTNSDTGITCEILNTNPTTATCAHKSWISANTVKIANELAEAYNKVMGKYPITIGAYNYTIKDSPVSPYQILTTAVDNAAGLFYRVNKEAGWQFFEAAQDAVNCKKFDAKDTRNAFAGEVCYDETKKDYATVEAWKEDE